MKDREKRERERRGGRERPRRRKWSGDQNEGLCTSRRQRGQLGLRVCLEIIPNQLSPQSPSCKTVLHTRRHPLHHRRRRFPFHRLLHSLPLFRFPTFFISHQHLSHRRGKIKNERREEKRREEKKRRREEEKRREEKRREEKRREEKRD